MIFILSYKIWSKKNKKLVEPKDYILIDATEDMKNLDKYVNTVTVDNLALPAKLIHIITNEDYDEIIDEDRIKELEDTFFDGLKFQTAVIATINTYLTQSHVEDINIFIVLRDKAYNYWRKRYLKEFDKIFPGCKEFVRILTKDVKSHKKELNQDLKKDRRKKFIKDLKEIEKDLEKKHKKERKKSGKKKDKIKNKKKWKESGMGFSFLD